jgi:SAM-dependent methyltransferase
MPGDFDYDSKGHGYAHQRRADPRITAMIHRALGDARTVLNVGAGAGSYEPPDRHVIAIEPSAVMRAQRPAHLAPAVNALAEDLPVDDRSVDASMGTLTVHQWSDLRKGLQEMRRVTRGPIVLLTFDGDAHQRFWLASYVPELIAVEQRRHPPMETLRTHLGAVGGSVEIHNVPIPFDCTDGFTEAFYARPERFLDTAVRRAQSSWGFVAGGVEDRFVRALDADLRSGAWDERFGPWRNQPFYEGSLRLVVARP